MQKYLLFFFIASAHSYEYPKPLEGYYSQHGQDKFLNEQVFSGKKQGVFVEIGAHDGISFSNTYFFERELGWSGICVEPIPELFQQLAKNRRCHLENLCVAENPGKKLFLKCSGYILEMYSGIVDYYDPRHVERIDRELAQYGGNKELMEVNCVTISDLVRKHNIKKIDLLCLDIEGGEEVVIRSINLDDIKVSVILVENNFNEEGVRSYLISKGYRFITRIGKDDIFQME